MISYRTILKSWDDFFFKPQPTESIALFRIVWGILIAFYFIFDFQNINDFYGPHALISLQTVKDQFPLYHLNIFHMFNSSYEFVYILFGIYFLAILSMILGFSTRTSIFVVFVCMTSIHQRNIWLLSSSELLLRLVTLLMIFAPSGNSLSIDSLLGRKFKSFKQDREYAPWVLRLIQIQLSVVYLWTVWHKLKGNNWIDGTAIYYATRLESIKNVTLPFLLDSVLFIKLATWGTLALEVCLGTLIWVKECRKPLIILGIIFHLGIELTMSLPFFEFIMITLLLLFFSPQEIRFFLQSTLQNWGKSLEQIPMYPELKSKILWVMKGEYAKS